MEKQTKMKKSTKYLLIGTLVLFLSILGASVAYYLARVSGSLSGKAAGTELTINVQKVSSNATGDLIPLDNDLETLNLAAAGYDDNGACVDINGYSVCQIYHITLTNNGTVPLDITGGVQLVGANTPNIDCAVMDNDTEVTSNNSCKGANTLADNDTLNAGASEDYYVLVYINNLDEPQYDKGEFIGTVSFTSTQGKRVKGRFNDTYNAASFIKDKFDSDESKTTVDAADGVQYKYATTEHLMYDRLGGTATNLEEGNLRYYGASPNNYIDIGDSLSAGYVTQKNWEKAGMMFADSDECNAYYDCKNNWQNLEMESEDACNATLQEYLPFFFFFSVEKLCKEEIKDVRELILWRIVGVFDGNLKIVRDNSIGDYSWDTSSSRAEDIVNNGMGVNEWSQADIMKLLNPGYEDNHNPNQPITNNSLYWNSGSGNCHNGQSDTSTSCDFTTTGLSDEVKDLIVDNLWYLGGANASAESQSFAKDYYALERGNNVIQNPEDGAIRTTKWTGKVGLLYPSDYGYATDLNACSENLSNYGSSSCKGNNWMPIDNVGTWTMTPDNRIDHSAFKFTANGIVFGYTSSASSVHPVMYLKKDAVIESGTGTKDDPYIAG